jgi:Protein of unknown function (DUF2934)
MAKKAPRSTGKLNSPANGPGPSAVQGAGPSVVAGPENISAALARHDEEPAAERVQQAPGDAMAARSTEEPTEEDIRARAYEMYLERGGHHGLDFDDWVRAERELRKR